MDDILKQTMEAMEQRLKDGTLHLSQEDLFLVTLFKMNEKLQSIDDALCAIDGRLFELVELAEKA